jgi:hypothetical protein
MLRVDAPGVFKSFDEAMLTKTDLKCEELHSSVLTAR